MGGVNGIIDSNMVLYEGKGDPHDLGGSLAEIGDCPGRTLFHFP